MDLVKIVLKIHKDHFLTHMLRKIFARRKCNLAKCVRPNPVNSTGSMIPISGPREKFFIGDNGQDDERILIFERQS